MPTPSRPAKFTPRPDVAPLLEHVEAASRPGAPPHLRPQGFCAFAADLLARFRQDAQMQSVQLTAKAVLQHPQPAQGLNIIARVRHRLELRVNDHPVEALDENLHNAYLATMLPYPAMAEGLFELTRDHPLVQRALALKATDTDGMRRLVLELADLVDCSFGYVQTLHDFGPTAAPPADFDPLKPDS